MKDVKMVDPSRGSDLIEIFFDRIGAISSLEYVAIVKADRDKLYKRKVEIQEELNELDKKAFEISNLLEERDSIKELSF